VTQEGVADDTIKLAAGYSAVKAFKVKGSGQAYLDATGLGMSLTAGKLVSYIKDG
jgi:hypothetical protein